MIHEVRTPEGIDIRFEVASIGRRAAAYAVDNTIIIAVLTVVGLIALIFIPDGWGIALFLTLGFIVRTFYFPLFEIYGRGQTWGKEMMGVRVVDVEGRPLTGNAVFLRSLSRETETLIPLIVIASPDAILPGAPPFFGYLALTWLVTIAILPFFNPKRRRAGDFVASTVVVLEPRLNLMNDLTANVKARRFDFTTHQLDIYGIQEIQLLEQILRDGDETAYAPLAQRISNKIHFKGKWHTDPHAFLLQFYKDARSRHESRMLVGDRQETKKEL